MSRLVTIRRTNYGVSTRILRQVTSDSSCLWHETKSTDIAGVVRHFLEASFTSNFQTASNAPSPTTPDLSYINLEHSNSVFPSLVYIFLCLSFPSFRGSFYVWVLEEYKSSNLCWETESPFMRLGDVFHSRVWRLQFVHHGLLPLTWAPKWFMTPAGSWQTAL